jgi:hypothetical protein
VSGDVLALVLGTVLAVGALAFVLHPLFFDTTIRVQAPRGAQRPDEDSAIRALREIEFDRATGKLSDTDYASLRARYADQALRELRGADAAATAGVAAVVTEDDIEARVRAYRAARRDCRRCGLRPEPDAIYCSTCGDYLGGACPACSAPITEASAAFCSTCGVPLAG